MELRGNLEDVTIIDVLQILGLTGRSGLLRIERSDAQAEIGFVDGRIATASLTPHRTYMASILLERGELDFDSLHRALQLQKRPEGAGKPIGSLLLEMEAVTSEQLQQALHLFIQRVVNTIASWTRGEFSFQLCAPPVGDDLSLVPAELALNLEISPQELLLEAARVRDEALHRAGGPADHETDASLDKLCTPDARAKAVDCLLLTDDLLVQHGLTDAQTAPEQIVRPVGDLAEAGARLAENAEAAASACSIRSLVVDVDWLAANSAPDDDLAFRQQLQPVSEAHPTVAMVTFGRGADARLYPLLDDRTIAFHVPRPDADADAAVVRRFLTTLGGLIARASQETLDPAAADTRARQQLAAEHQRLYESVVTLRRSHHSVTVSLEVLRYVAADLERAVLLLTHQDSLVLLGVFGVPDEQRQHPGRPVSKLRLPLHPSPALDQLFADKRLMSWEPEARDETFAPLLEQIGLPRRPDSYLIPLVVRNKVFAVIYADNGDLDAPLPPGEPFGVLVEHGSQLLENLLLRRRQAPAPAAAAIKAG